MSDDVHTGRCFCGDVRFEISGPVRYSAFCHCESCRRASGGAYVPWVTFDEGALRWTSGTVMLHESSPGVIRGHCPRCGTSLTYRETGRSGQVDITLASFDDPSPFKPLAHIWMEDRLPCVHVGDDLPRYTRGTGSKVV